MAVVSMFAAIRNLQTKSGDFLVKVNISYRSRCNSAYTDHEEHVEYSWSQNSTDANVTFGDEDTWVKIIFNMTMGIP